MKMTLRIANWLWFPSCGRDLIRMSYRPADECSAHLTDCYFCIVPPIQKRITKKKKQTVKYPNRPLAIRPLPHCECVPIAEHPDSFSLG
jgi:hypothetical protein